MPWWVIVYLVLLVLLSTGGLWDDLNDRRPWWVLVSGGLSAVASVLLALAFWRPAIGEALGGWVAALLAFAIGWDAWSLRNDHRAMAADPDLSRWSRLGPWIAVLILAPAYVWGLLVLLRG